MEGEARGGEEGRHSAIDEIEAIKQIRGRKGRRMGFGREGGARGGRKWRGGVGSLSLYQTRFKEKSHFRGTAEALTEASQTLARCPKDVS